MLDWWPGFKITRAQRNGGFSAIYKLHQGQVSLNLSQFSTELSKQDMEKRSTLHQLSNDML